MRMCHVCMCGVSKVWYSGDIVSLWWQKQLADKTHAPLVWSPDSGPHNQPLLSLDHKAHHHHHHHHQPRIKTTILIITRLPDWAYSLFREIIKAGPCQHNHRLVRHRPCGSPYYRLGQVHISRSSGPSLASTSVSFHSHRDAHHCHLLEGICSPHPLLSSHAIIWGSLLIWFTHECKWVRKMPNLFETPQHVCMINTPERIIGASSVWARKRSQKLPIYLPSRFAFNNFDHMQIICISYMTHFSATSEGFLDILLRVENKM